MRRNISISRRLIGAVLVLELVAAVCLIAAITIHEWSVQLKAFDAALSASAESLMGAVQDSDDQADTVMLDLRAARFDPDAIFRVEDDRGGVLGSVGEIPSLEESAHGTLGIRTHGFRNAELRGRNYRFLVLNGLRIVDPGQPDGGIRHNITIIYGRPTRHVRHEVFEAVRFFAIATAILLGITAVVLAWLVHKGLEPVHELAHEAERIGSRDWRFDAPQSAKQTVELRSLAEALETALARLQRSFEQQRRFTNDAAHELKTDVAIVKSSLQLMSMRHRSVEEYSQGLALSLDDVTRLETAVQRMLTLARLEQPAPTEMPDAAAQSCSLRDVMEDALNQSKALAELKNVSVRLDLISDVKVPIDSRDGLLLSSNILLNALQHAPNGTTVRIHSLMAGDRVRLTVEDQGEGVPPQDRDRVFEPFYRGDPSRSRKSGGTGLGLSICRAICERAGGSIEIDNTPTGGALVTVLLPGQRAALNSPLSASLKVT